MQRDKQTPTKLGKKRTEVPPVGATAHNDELALSPAQQLGSLGGAARAQRLTAKQRSEIAKKAAAKRWER
jgi:hypothetical protein